MGSFEVLEHTADVGIRATAATLEGCFEQAGLGLLAIIGINHPGEGDERVVELRDDDLGSLLVDWLGEILFLTDARDAVVTHLEVVSLEEGRLSARIALAPRTLEVEGTQVKAITYHRLRVEPTAGGWIAEVYLDV